jgi:hypothetical protein
VRDGHVALGDRDEARQTGLRGEQIVPTGIQRAVGAVADREQLSHRVEQEAEVHTADQRSRSLGDEAETAPERVGWVDVACVALDARANRLRPDEHFGLGAFGIGVDHHTREIHHAPRACLQFRKP